MIQPGDLVNLKSYIEDESRYKPLHSYVENYNKLEATNKLQYTNIFFHLKPNIWESPDLEKDDIPFIAGFKEDLDKNIAKGIVSIKENKRRSISSDNMYKRDTDYIGSTEPGEENYDYHKFKREYEEQIVKDISTNKTLNYTDTEKLKEDPNEVLQKLLDVKNCTDISRKSGIKTIDCLIHNYEQQKNEPAVKKTLSKIWLIFKIWFLIYICLAVPCWCHKGWCCCCFRCKICFPKKRILFAKQYYITNPPGTLSKQAPKKGEKEFITYEPTEFEEDAYEVFEAAIRNI
ncbi:hypothetical protein ANTQUA_LOCUS7635 [Anthophora quadrimaculata]